MTKEGVTCIKQKMDPNWWKGIRGGERKRQKKERKKEKRRKKEGKKE